MFRPGQLLTFIMEDTVQNGGNSYDGISHMWINYDLGAVVMFVGNRDRRFLVLDGDTLRELDSTKWEAYRGKIYA